MTNDYAVTDHAQALADLLKGVVRRLEQGETPEGLGDEVQLIGRVMSRRT